MLERRGGFCANLTFSYAKTVFKAYNGRVKTWSVFVVLCAATSSTTSGILSMNPVFIVAKSHLILSVKILYINPHL